MPTNDFVPFGLSPGSGYVLTPSQWASSTVRTTGYGPGLLLKENLNTAMRQASSISTMLANFIAANQAGDVQDNADLTTLQAQLTTALLNLSGSQATHYQIATPNAASVTTRTVTLGAGTWQMLMLGYLYFVDPGNYGFNASIPAAVTGSLVSMSATATAQVVRTGGSGFGRSIFPTLTAVNQMTVTTPGTFTMTISPVSKPGFVTCTGAVLTLDKIA